MIPSPSTPQPFSSLLLSYLSPTESCVNPTRTIPRCSAYAHTCALPALPRDPDVYIQAVRRLAAHFSARPIG